MAERSYGSNLWSTTLTSTMGSTDLAAAVSTTADGPTSPAWMVVETETPANVEVIYFDGTFDGTTFRCSSISNRYQQGSAATSGLTHPSGATVISSPLWSQIKDVWDYLAAHEASSNVHGATAVATGSTIVRRDSAGRAQFSDPSASADVVTVSFLDQIVPIGGIILWSGSTGSIPSRWALCNGSNGTPNLTDRFVVGAGNSYSVGATGGSTTHSHSGPSHNHSWSDTSSSAGGHSHDVNLSGDTSNRGIAGGGAIVSPASHDHGNTDSVGGHTHSVSGTTSSSGTGSTGTTSSRPPYYALAYIMRVS